MDAPSARRPSRRTVARGAAWSVPVIAVGAAAPAFAASGGTASVTATCIGAGSQIRFSVTVTGATGDFVRFTLVGDRRFGVTYPNGWTSVSSTGFVWIFDVPVLADGSASGVATVTPSGLGNGQTLNVTGTISSTTGQTIDGDTSSSGSIRRQGQGQSTNYFCSAS